MCSIIDLLEPPFSFPFSFFNYFGNFCQSVMSGFYYFKRAPCFHIIQADISKFGTIFLVGYPQHLAVRFYNLLNRY
jgi:hypothetical protein